MKTSIKQKNVVPVVFATNENYAPYAGVTITSLIENSSKEFFYDIYVFHTDLCEKTIGLFGLMHGENYNVTCVDVNSYIEKELLYENFHFSKEMYYRVLIPTVLPQYKKVLYLDCDIVVLKDISKLYNTNINDYLLGGIQDEQHEVSKKYVTEELGIDTGHYINSGVLLINCELFRTMRMKEKCFEVLKNSPIKFRYPDQDMINIACSGKIKFLDSTWNYIWHYNFPRYNRKVLMLSEEDQKKYEEKSKNISILHYTSNIKPWNNYNTIYSKYFFNYVDKTPAFKSIIYKRYNALKMKNYIALQSLEIVNSKAYLIGVYYTTEDFAYHNKLYVTINGKRTHLPYTHFRNIDLRNNCYVQSFFRIQLDLSKINKKSMYIGFSRKNHDKERLPVLTGKYFPIDAGIGSKLFYQRQKDIICFSIQKKEFVISRSCESEKLAYEKELRKKLKKMGTKRAKKSLLLRKIYFFTKKFFKKPIWLISDRSFAAGDNGEALFKYLSKNPPKDAKVYFVINKKLPDAKRLKKYGKIVDPKSYKYYLLYLHCSKMISSQLPREIIEPYQDVYIKDLLFKKKVVFLQHGVTKDDVSLSYSRLNQNINYFVTTGKPETKSILENPNYDFMKHNVLETGFARYDYLENDPKKIIYLMPTWRHYLTNIKESADFEKSEYFKRYNSLLHNKYLLAILKKTGYKLKFVPHVLMRPFTKFFNVKSDLVEILYNGVNYNQIFKDGAVMITDYSSVAFDFAYLKKPVIYYQFDANEFFSGHTYTKGYYDYEKDGFGPVVYNEIDVLKSVVQCLIKKCKMRPEYKKRVEDFFAFNDKNNCARIVDAICKYDVPKPSLFKRYKLCLKEHGAKYTIKRIFAKLIGR